MGLLGAAAAQVPANAKLQRRYHFQRRLCLAVAARIPAPTLALVLVARLPSLILPGTSPA